MNADNNLDNEPDNESDNDFDNDPDNNIDNDPDNNIDNESDNDSDNELEDNLAQEETVVQPKEASAKELRQKKKEVPTKTGTTFVVDENFGPSNKGAALAFNQMYASLMILLMTFFIVLVSKGTMSAKKFAAVKGGLSDSFSVFGITEKKDSEWFADSINSIANSLNISPDQEEATEQESLEEEAEQEEELGDLEAQDMIEKVKKTISKKEQEEEIEEKEEKEKDIQFEKEEEIQKDKFLGEGYSKLKIVISSEIIFLGGNIERKGNELYISLPAKRLFYYGDSRLKMETLDSFKRIMNLLKEEDFSLITVRCFTEEDTVQELADFSYFGLACLRGKQLCDFLVKDGGIARKKICNIGFGNVRSEPGSLVSDMVEIVIN